MSWGAWFFLLRIRRPPRSTLFPYTTLSPSRRPCRARAAAEAADGHDRARHVELFLADAEPLHRVGDEDRKSTRLNSSHANKSYAVFCLKKKEREHQHVRGHRLPDYPRGLHH